jgi:hypothetical protein
MIFQDGTLIDFSSDNRLGFGMIHPVIVNGECIAPSDLGDISTDEAILKIYSTIYYNTLASVMKPAHFTSIDLEIGTDDSNEMMLNQKVGSDLKNFRFLGSVRHIESPGHLVAKAKLFNLYYFHGLNSRVSISSNNPENIEIMANTPLKTDLFLSEDQLYDNLKYFETVTIIGNYDTLSQAETIMDENSSEKFTTMINAPYKELTILNQFEKEGVDSQSIILALKELSNCDFYRLDANKTIQLTLKSFFIHQVLMQEISKFFPIFKKISEVNMKKFDFVGPLTDFQKAFQEFSKINEAEHQLHLKYHSVNRLKHFMIRNQILFGALETRGDKGTDYHEDKFSQFPLELLNEPCVVKNIKNIAIRNETIIFSIDDLQDDMTSLIKQVVNKYKCIQLMNDPNTGASILLEQGEHPFIALLKIVKIDPDRNESISFKSLPTHFYDKQLSNLNEDSIFDILNSPKSDLLVFVDTHLNLTIFVTPGFDNGQPGYITIGSVKIPLNANQKLDELTRHEVFKIVYSFLKEKRIVRMIKSKFGWITIAQNRDSKFFATAKVRNGLDQMFYQVNFALPEHLQGFSQANFMSSKLDPSIISEFERMLNKEDEKKLNNDYY